MKRRLFNLAVAISSLLSVACAVMWVRSYYCYTPDVISHETKRYSDRSEWRTTNESFHWRGQFGWIYTTKAASSLEHIPLQPVDVVRIDSGWYVGWKSDHGDTLAYRGGTFESDFWTWSHLGFKYTNLGFESPFHHPVPSRQDIIGILFPYCSLQFILLMPAMWWVVARYRQSSAVARRKRGLCPTCGYDLRATPERCPECGAIPSGMKI